MKSFTEHYEKTKNYRAITDDVRSNLNILDSYDQEKSQTTFVLHGTYLSKNISYFRDILESVINSNFALSVTRIRAKKSSKFLTTDTPAIVITARFDSEMQSHRFKEIVLVELTHIIAGYRARGGLH